jgi:hypothetical protein
MLEEIVPGIVAILETKPLLNDPDVKRSESIESFRNGPFLCVEVENNFSVWLSITTRKDARGLRLELRQEWLLEGSHIWRSAPQYINDARKPFVGPNSAFVTAGANEKPHRPHLRPCVSPEAISAVVTELKSYGITTL